MDSSLDIQLIENRQILTYPLLVDTGRLDRMALHGQISSTETHTINT